MKKVLIIVLLTLLVCLATWTIAGQRGEKGTEKEAAAYHDTDQKINAETFLQTKNNVERRDLK